MRGRPCSKGWNQAHVIYHPMQDSFRLSQPVFTVTIATVICFVLNVASVDLSAQNRDREGLRPSCHRFDNSICLEDPRSGRESQRFLVQREPSAACLSSNGQQLFVANYLPSGRSDTDEAAAKISVIDVGRGKVIKQLALPNGGNLINSLSLSPDGRFLVATHIVAGFNRATTHLRAGWLNSNGLTAIDAQDLAVIGSVLLDEPNRGAANPWGAAWADDSKTVVVTHSGTHEVSVIDFPSLLSALLYSRTNRPGYAASLNQRSGVLHYHVQYEGIDPGLPFLTGARRRIKLPDGDLGPREVAVVGRTAYVTNYFSETVTAIDLNDPAAKPRSMRRDGSGAGGRPTERTRQEVLAAMSLEKRGEFYFNDASICLQGWQSCASCHPDGRADGLNWDLLNDGIGSPKNTKSLLYSFKTPPAMSTGIRKSAHEAVVAGLEHILFTEAREDVVAAMEAYIRSLKPVPSPRLVSGELSASALRGGKVFRKAGCADCHSGRLFTDLGSYDVGTRGPHDKPADTFDTPSLIEIWRTAPYLHDGSAATVRDVVASKNRQDQHGTTSTLTGKEIDDLCEYLLSL